jgi:hypothetical protein
MGTTIYRDKDLSKEPTMLELHKQLDKTWPSTLILPKLITGFVDHQFIFKI